MQVRGKAFDKKRSKQQWTQTMLFELKKEGGRGGGVNIVYQKNLKINAELLKKKEMP